jgi:hypothetical protein
VPPSHRENEICPEIRPKPRPGRHFVLREEISGYARRGVLAFVQFSRGRRPLFATLAVAMGLSACRASVKAKANVNSADAELEDDRRWETPEPATPPPQEAQPATPAGAVKEAPRVAAAVAAAPAPAPSAPFFGVTHDLSLSSAAAQTATCRCLAVGYGAPSDGKFSWQTGQPLGGRDVVAIAIRAVSCGDNAEPPRVSIAGVEREGADIVLTVENVGEGGPIMRGVIAPYPGPNASIVVRTRHDTPYPAASGAGPCRIPMR